MRDSNADKHYNARAMLADGRRLGGRLWERFNATKEYILWYYWELSRIFSDRNPGYLADELKRAVDNIHRLAQ